MCEPHTFGGEKYRIDKVIWKCSQTHIHTYQYTHTDIHTYTCTGELYIYIYIYTYIHVHVHVHVYALCFPFMQPTTDAVTSTHDLMAYAHVIYHDVCTRNLS
jgi:hypothetical protein